MHDVWTTKNHYMITWLNAANQMTYAALADVDFESQQKLALAPTETKAKVIYLSSGKRQESFDGNQPLR